VFSAQQADVLENLCLNYDPLGASTTNSLGYGGAGALIAFAHGVPNNAPRMLFKKTSNWAPLFPARVTSESRMTFLADDREAIADRLYRMRQSRLAEAVEAEDLPQGSQGMALVLAALARSPRTRSVVALRTGLTMYEVDQLLERARRQGWIDDGFRLTDQGQSELAAARGRGSSEPLQPTAKTLYFPTALRAPVSPSS
jgi:hypothetical protein